jgi:predicted nucleotidyltransferase
VEPATLGVPMNFERVIRRVVGELEAADVHYALIGGFAMALRGVQRATMDLDFILMMEDLAKADKVLTGCGYERVFHSENVSHYASVDRDWGRIDILHAFRGPTLSMLERAETVSVLDDLRIKVVHIEDIIGLKVQALVNNPLRAARDWADIRMILEAAKEQGRLIDWGLLEDYLEIFKLEAKLAELKVWYGPIDSR